jgi:tetratricopeptide (TPR) repeat protein
MERIEKTVFLAYRPTNIPWALAIFQNLAQHGYDVFFDYSGIASEDFERVMLENIRARAHFLVLLTPSALEHSGDPGDWLRREIELAIESQRNIVPLMLEGFNFGTPAIASQLTGTLEQLRNYNALTVPADYFLEAMGRLRDRYLNIPLSTELQPASLPARKAAAEQKKEAAAAPQVAEEELTAQQWFERGFNAADLDEKIRFYDNAIRLKPDYAEAFNNRGNARGDKKHFAGALADYAKALEIKSDDPEVFYNRGITRNQMGDLDDAIRDYNEAIRLKPSYAAAFANRGSARHAKGDLDGAIEDYDEAIRLNPDYVQALNNRGWLRLQKRDLDGAIADCNEAIRLKPDFAEAFDSRGYARQLKGDLEAALEDYNEAIRLKPDYAIAIANRDALLKAMADASKNKSS